MNRLLSMLGLARRAGKISWGRDATEEVLRKGKVSLVLLAQDISEKTAAGVRFSAERAGAPVLTVRETIESISQAIGKRAGIVAILDDGFADSITAIAQKADADNSEKGR